MSQPPPPGDRVRIFDTTLRDGEQAPGCTMSLAEKLQVAEQLARLRVDVIEAGFPASSPGEHEAVSAIAERVGTVAGPIICGLARANHKDIDAVATAVARAKKRRIHTFLATSDIHLEHKLRMTRAQVLQRAADAVRYARAVSDDVEFSPEDAGRSDRGFLREVLQAAIEAGATTLNIPDTVGYVTPSEYGSLIAEVVALAARTGVIISTHCHDDLGLAVANSLAGVATGARQVECTVNGIGERAGNASMEEVVMALRTRANFYGVDTGIDIREIARASRLVSACTGIYLPPNKAIVGGNAFAHEAGIHQDGILKHRLTYEIMTAESVGMDGTLLVLGKHSGRHALKRRLAELGYEMGDEEFHAVFDRFKELADRKKTIDDRDLVALMAVEKDGKVAAGWAVEQIQVTCGTHTIPTATVRLRDPAGEIRTASGTGDGPVDAVCRAINVLLGELGQLCEFQVHAVTEGIDAVGRVTVRVRDFHTKRVYLGHGVRTDVVSASGEAYVAALNHLLAARAGVAKTAGAGAKAPTRPTRAAASPA